MDENYLGALSPIERELYFLIAKFLENGPCQKSAKVLKNELTNHKILPKRIDWEGDEHDQSFYELEQKFPHIGPRHLLEICKRIGPILDREFKPNVPGVRSLLGVGRQSLLRTSCDVERPWMNMVYYSVRKHQRSLSTPVFCKTHNLVKVLHGRENSGPLARHHAVTNHIYTKTQLLCCTLGHLSAVYCLLFDRTGKYIITGADDLLVKIWSAIDGRLLSTLRGASAEISDIAVNVENTLLAAGSIDRLIRVWCLQTAYPVAVLTAHTGMITGVNFCPAVISGKHYLASTSSDCSVAFWSYTCGPDGSVTFQPKAIQFSERTRPGQAQMICASFSPGGMFLAAGSADHHVRVYKMAGPEGPHRVLEVQPHTDRVDSIQWANRSLRFVSGSKDGTAIIWRYTRQRWKPLHLYMSTRLTIKNIDSKEEDSKVKLKVTMVSWDAKDQWIVTACSDYSLKVWDSFTGTLIQILNGHKDEVFVLEGHPLESQIFLSAGHDGMILLWDVITGNQIKTFQNHIVGQGYGAVFDAKWSPDGTMMAATDSHGQLLLFGLGSVPPKMLQLPKELFFHTDYRPLVRDSNHCVLDEQTQVAPHLMPPPFLVDIDGNPYPPYLQRLVPGRENCRTEQLVPNIMLTPGGQQEVIEGLSEPRSNIDQMIQALAQRYEGNQPPPNSSAQHTSPRSRVGARRNGDVEGVRQSSGNWQRDEFSWTQRQLIRPLDKPSLLMARAKIESFGELELEEYEHESARPMEIEVPVNVPKPGRKQRKRHKHTYRTRAAHEEELQSQYENPDNMELSGSASRDSSSSHNDSTARSEDLGSTSSSSESPSSEYSDWIADHGVNLEPPKRRSRRKRKPNSQSPAAPTKPPPSKKQQPQEVPELYRPSEWLSEVVAKKFPYYPQMGDEVLFFKQGYQLYLDAVRQRKVYELAPSQITPWGKLNIKEPELVKVIGIKYELRPPRLCCLRLAVMRRNGRLTGDYFTIKYHDIPDVIDFLVLRQTYDTALDRSWEVGDRFRSMIDDHWWWGVIDRRTQQNSDFLCYRIIWDNGEMEQMSPWDMEPTDRNCEPAEIGGSVPVMPEEIAAILYHPRPDEWPAGDRDTACDRIIQGLEQVMELSIAEPFIAPVDINRYPSYACIVEYPIDLSTIKARFENRFYRRVTAAQFDVRYLATNTEKFNEAHSTIVKNARIITDLCLKIIKDPNHVNVGALYRQLLDAYKSSESSESEEAEDSDQPGPSSGNRVRATLERSLRASRRGQNQDSRPFDWKRECRELLEHLWTCRDSEPFREPVDRLEHPDYDKVIDTPMDLGTIREELRGDNYETPVDFCKDIRRIFINSKNYTPDKHSRIYAMTVRLSALAEVHMRRILGKWKSTMGGNKKQGGKAQGRKQQRRTKVINSEPSGKTQAADVMNKKLRAEYKPSSSGMQNGRAQKRQRKKVNSDDETVSENGFSYNQSSIGHGRKRRKRKVSSDDDTASESDYEPSRGLSSARSRKQIKKKVVPVKQNGLVNNDYMSRRPMNCVGKRKVSAPPKPPVSSEDETSSTSSSSDNEESPPPAKPTPKAALNGHVTRRSMPRQVKTDKKLIEVEEDDDEESDEDNQCQKSDSESTDEESEVNEKLVSNNNVHKNFTTYNISLRGKKRRKASDSEDSYKPSVNASVSRSTRWPCRSTERKNYAAMLASNTDEDDEIQKTETKPKRNRGRPRKVGHSKYKENSDDDSSDKRNNSDSSGNERTPQYSVSSRGRIRKLTPRARALLRD